MDGEREVLSARELDAIPYVGAVGRAEQRDSPRPADPTGSMHLTRIALSIAFPCQASKRCAPAERAAPGPHHRAAPMRLAQRADATAAPRQR
eukprot:1718154-Pleurochrysis_carterae.AAC.3